MNRDAHGIHLIGGVANPVAVFVALLPWLARRGLDPDGIKRRSESSPLRECSLYIAGHMMHNIHI